MFDRGRCRRLDRAELPMRELKPLRTDTYDTSDSVYARNNAFTQSQLATSATRGSSDGGDITTTNTGDVCEYEYVIRQGVAVGHTQNRPDIIRLDRCQCGTNPTTGRYSNIDAKMHLIAKNTSAGSSNSNSCLDVTQEPVTSLRVCHHCGYASLTETVQRAGVTVSSAAPGSGTLPRRVVSNTMATTQYSASVTLPRRHLQSQSRTNSPPPPILPCKKL